MFGNFGCTTARVPLCFSFMNESKPSLSLWQKLKLSSFLYFLHVSKALVRYVFSFVYVSIRTQLLSCFESVTWYQSTKKQILDLYLLFAHKIIMWQLEIVEAMTVQETQPRQETEESLLAKGGAKTRIRTGEAKPKDEYFSSWD